MLDTARPGMPRRDVVRGRGWPAMLVELSVMEQHYHAVMEVVSGALVTEVAWLNHATGRTACGGRSRALRSGDPRDDQGLEGVGPQAIDPVGEVPVFEVC